MAHRSPDGAGRAPIAARRDALSAAHRPAVHRAGVVRKVDGRGDHRAPVVGPGRCRRPRCGHATRRVGGPSAAAGVDPQTPTGVVPVEAQRDGHPGTGTAPIGTASPTAGTDVSWTAGFAPRPPASLGEHEVIRRPELDGDRVRTVECGAPESGRDGRLEHVAAARAVDRAAPANVADTGRDIGRKRVRGAGERRARQVGGGLDSRTRRCKVSNVRTGSCPR